MPLFIVEHQHAAETCPAGDRQMAPMLLAHLAPSNAEQYQVNIHSHGVVDGGHRLVLIVDAPDQEDVEKYMAPFAMAGSVDVSPASTCEVVVARAAC